MSRTEHLVDVLSDARVSSPGPGHVDVQRISIARDTRVALFQHPPSEVVFGPFTEAPVRLRIGCGVKQVVWPKMQGAITFSVLVRSGDEETEIFSKRLDPRRRRRHRRWHDVDLDLASFTTPFEIVLRTDVRRDRSAYAWGAWADPVLELAEEPAARSVLSRHRHVFLITADALRRDVLGCYGSSAVRTPSIDALAADGVVAEHARAQTSTTIGSYVSIHTGMHPSRHGIAAEWGRVPDGLQTLASSLAGAGYHTVIAPSEGDLAAPELNLATGFAERFSVIGSPSQDGSITTRRALRWLDRMPDRPCFAWLHYFDTHPPQTPPEPFRSMYYAGDPTARDRVDRPENVALIRAVETVYEVKRALPLLHSGIPDAAVVAKIGATRAALRGDHMQPPDLAIHLNALGAPALPDGMTDGIVPWLDDRIVELRAGTVSEALLVWLHKLLVVLGPLEDDILTWLDGVVDFRYPYSQYMGGVSYLDDQVGRIVASLKDRDLYDDSIVIVTSPHGELFGEREIVWGHHAALEGVLQIPFVMKPSAGTGQRGVRTGGIFDSIDLFPTLADALDVTIPTGIDGKSRWPELASGHDIDDHDSFALDSGAAMATIVREPFKLVLALDDHMTSPGWTWRKGEHALFDLRATFPEEGDVASSYPEVVTELSAALDRWLSTTRS